MFAMAHFVTKLLNFIGLLQERPMFGSVSLSGSFNKYSEIIFS